MLPEQQGAYHVDKILKRNTDKGQKEKYGEEQREEPDKQAIVQEESPFFGVSRLGEREISFLIKFQDGTGNVIQYHDLISPYSFGPGFIELHTPTASIKITGRNLDKILHHIRKFHLDWIKEPDVSFIKLKEGEPEIQKVEVTER